MHSDLHNHGFALHFHRKEVKWKNCGYLINGNQSEK